jgi:hypothetical protein
VIALKIGAMARDFNGLDNIEESWINQQIGRLRREHQPVCVRVTVNEGPVNFTLATAECAPSGGGGRLPNAQEAQAFELWDKLGLSKPGFSGGNLVAFFKQLRRIID